MPDFSALMNNPMFASMAQNLMSNPEALQGIPEIHILDHKTLIQPRSHEQSKVKRDGPGHGKWWWYARHRCHDERSKLTRYVSLRSQNLLAKSDSELQGYEDDGRGRWRWR